MWRGANGKAIRVIELAVEDAARRVGLERLGFLTLTFRDHVTDKREAQRRFNSLATNVLRHRYAGGLVVWERQQSQRLHAHLLVCFHAGDIRTGVDFDAIAARDYRSAGAQLRAEWAFWRRTAPAYGFGRTELLPVKSEAGAMAAYVGKYLGKDLGTPEDKGARRYALFGCLKGVANQNHQAATSKVWRSVLAEFAGQVSAAYRVPATWEGLELALGKGWMWRWRDQLAARCDAAWKARTQRTEA